MGYTVAEAQAEKARRQKMKAGDYTVEEAQAEKQRRLAAVTTPMDAIKNLLGVGKTGLQIPMVAGQDLGNLLAGIPGAMPLARKITGALPENIRRELAALRTDRVIDKPTLGARIGGGVLAGITGAELPGAALGAIPKIAELAAAFPRIARAARPLLLGAGGAAISPEHRLRGFLTGTALGAGLEAPGAAPEIARGATAIATKISPNRYAKEILKRIPKYRTGMGEEFLNKLSGGEELPENTKKAATAIRRKYGLLQERNTTHFSPVEEAAGKESIYKNTLPFNPFKKRGTYITHESKPVVGLTPKEATRIINASLPKEEPDILFPEQSYVRSIKHPLSPVKNYTPLLRQAHNEFIAKPTYKNANRLQSDLYKQASKLAKAPASDQMAHDIKDRMFASRNGLIKDIERHFDTMDPTGNLAKRYEFARNFHREEVVPYHNKRLIDISKGRIRNPRNLTTTFKNPEEDVRKVVDDLGPEFKNRILYHDLRKTVGINPTDEKLADAYEKLTGKGLEEYKAPQLDAQINTLKENAAKKSAVDELLKGAGKKPTAKTLSKSFEKLEKNRRDEQLPSSLQNQLDRLRTRLKTKGKIKKVLKKGALWTGGGALGYGGWKLGHLLD